MSSDQRDSGISIANDQEIDYVPHHGGDESPTIRDIHALAPPPPPTAQGPSSSSPPAVAEGGESFTTISREFNALVLAGSRIRTENDQTNLTGIGEGIENSREETNPLAIVMHDGNPAQSPSSPSSGGAEHGALNGGHVSTQQQVKKAEAESKINAWQNAKIAKINNRFKREDAIINGWEGEQVREATSWMKKVERKLEEKRAKAVEKMQNDIAKAHKKAEERRASAEARRGTKVARVMEIASLMRAVGKPPTKRSFF